MGIIFVIEVIFWPFFLVIYSVGEITATYFFIYFLVQAKKYNWYLDDKRRFIKALTAFIIVTTIVLINVICMILVSTGVWNVITFHDRGPSTSMPQINAIFFLK